SIQCIPAAKSVYTTDRGVCNGSVHGSAAIPVLSRYTGRTEDKSADAGALLAAASSPLRSSRVLEGMILSSSCIAFDNSSPGFYPVPAYSSVLTPAVQYSFPAVYTNHT